MKKTVSAILLFTLLCPLFAPLASLASLAPGAFEADACATGGGHDCMEGDRCTLNHKQCRMHGAKKETRSEGHNGGHHEGHHEGMVSESSQCATFYECGADAGVEAFFKNPLETPFLLSANHLGAALPLAGPVKTVEPAYEGPSMPLPDRPPSLSL